MCKMWKTNISYEGIAMKLILCPHCNDLFRMYLETRTCKCGSSFGKHINADDVIVSKDAIIIKMENQDIDECKIKCSKDEIIGIRTWKIQNRCRKIKRYR